MQKRKKTIPDKTEHQICNIIKLITILKKKTKENTYACVLRVLLLLFYFENRSFDY